MRRHPHEGCAPLVASESQFLGKVCDICMRRRNIDVTHLGKIATNSAVILLENGARIATVLLVLSGPPPACADRPSLRCRR